MLWNAILLALREIRRNVLRSSLTMLGIVIGVAAVIIMVTLGSGATAKVTADISSLGSNLLQVRPGHGMHGPGGRAPVPNRSSSRMSRPSRAISPAWRRWRRWSARRRRPSMATTTGRPRCMAATTLSCKCAPGRCWTAAPSATAKCVPARGFACSAPRCAGNCSADRTRWAARSV